MLKANALLLRSHIVEARVIDKINILQAAMLAMEKAVEKLPERPEYVLVDGNYLPKVKSTRSLTPLPPRCNNSFLTHFPLSI